jgi:cadmium resistance protein CadD (predicted permease)
MNDILHIIIGASLGFLLIIQYSMIVADIKNNNAKAWEIFVGIIPFGPYLLMFLTAIWHLATMPFKNR